MVIDIGKRGPDRLSASNTLSFGEKIVKIGTVDHVIIVPREIDKKEKKKKKLTQAKYIALPASLSSGLYKSISDWKH